MTLFHDVTTDYTKRPRHQGDAASPTRMSMEELRRLHASGLAIADTETTGLKAGEHGLTEPAVIRAMTVAEIKAYNREAERLGLPTDQRIPLSRGYADRDIRLIVLQHFVLPNRPMIHDAKDGHALPRGSYNSDRQKAFEYDISAYALGVTGTELLRKKGYGPLSGLKVDGARVKTLESFLPLMHSFLLFTGQWTVGPKRGVAYFNAPFDIPFLRELFVDAMAYEAAKQNEHRDARRAVHGHLPRALDIDYGAPNTTPEQRAQILAHIKKRLMDSGLAQARLAEYFAPARWHCVLQAYRAAHPDQASHTLDSLMKQAGLAGAERGAHSAIEDVVLTARGMLHLLDRGELRQDSLPTMGELPGVVLWRSHGESARSASAENGRDVEISWTPPKAEKLHAKAVTHWVESAQEASPAELSKPALNPHAKPWFKDFSAEGAVLSGAHKRPLFLSFTRHLAVASQLLDGRYPWLTALAANDSPGSLVDATVDGKIVQDVPWNILRRNVAYLNDQPQEARGEWLSFLRDVAAANPVIAGVLLREEEGRRSLRIYGHVRQHGTVDIPLPTEMPIAEVRTVVLANLENAVRLGLVPYAARGDLGAATPVERDEDSAEAEKGKRSASPMVYSSTTLDLFSAESGPHIYREITPALFQLFKAALPPGVRKGDFNQRIHTVKYGKHFYIAVTQVTRGEESFIAFDGPLEAFDAYVASLNAEGEYKSIADKPTNILTDAAWLLDRLQKIPGVPKDGVEVSANNRILIHQPLGISSDALALMQVAEIPYRANAREIRTSAGAMMQDAFTHSLAISRALEKKTYENYTAPTSIVPSLVKGLKDTSGKTENHKRLSYVKFDPLLGLQLYYKARGEEAPEVLRIPLDKMVARTMPIGRRRVQRVFARLKYLPEKIESIDQEARWEVSLTPLEKRLFLHALQETNGTVEWRKNTKNADCFVITESALSARGNPIYMAMKRMSDQLAGLTQSTDIPEWFFASHPEIMDEKIALQLPERTTLFTASAPPVYAAIQSFLQRLEKGGNGASGLNAQVTRVTGNRFGAGGSALKGLHYSLRRDVTAELSILLNTVEREAPALLALNAHARALAGAITPSDKMEEKDRRALALNQQFFGDRVILAQMIAACDAMADKDTAQTEEWRQMRHKTTDVADRLARTIHGTDRLREALLVGARSIANDGPHWRSSLLGAAVHARLDSLEEIYLKAASANAPDMLIDYVVKQQKILRDIGKDIEGEKGIKLLRPYCEQAALRLAVLYATEQNTGEQKRYKKAALQALHHTYGMDETIAENFLNLYKTISKPEMDAARCRAAGKKFLESLPADQSTLDETCYWLPMRLFGKASAADMVAQQQEKLSPEIEKELQRAYRAVGAAHLYLAADLGAQLHGVEAISKNKQSRAYAVDLQKQMEFHQTQMRRAYAAAGAKSTNIENTLRKQTRAACEGRPAFAAALAKHKAFLEWQQQVPALPEYSGAQQQEILRAAILDEGGAERLAQFLAAERTEEKSLDALLRAVAIHQPNFRECRNQVNKRAILQAKNRMLNELEDLGKIEYHTRRDLEALGLLLQEMVVSLSPQLEATPIKPVRMDTPEFQGLLQNPIPQLREGAKKLDAAALTAAKQKLNPAAALTQEELQARQLQHSLQAVLGQAGLPSTSIASHKAASPEKSSKQPARDYFILDTSAVIGYFETLRQQAPRPSDTQEEKPDFGRYHANLLARISALASPEAHGYMPLRVPDYVFYELSGLNAPVLQRAARHFAAIESRCAESAKTANNEQKNTLLRERAREYQVEIDHLVDWSVRLDRRRPLDSRSSLGDRVEELNQLFTLFAYHPEIVLPTHVGQVFYESAKVESAVVAGVGFLKRPATAAHYREQLHALEAMVTSPSVVNKPAIAHYSLSFDDLLQTPGMAAEIDNLRIHWGQMYFMGLIGEDQYRNYMRNMGGTEAANAQGYDTSKRFVSYGSIMHQTRQTGLTESGLVEAVKTAHDAMVAAGEKPEMAKRHNLTFGELQKFSGRDVRAAIGPAKLTMDQCVFSGLLPGAAIKRYRDGEDYSVRENDADAELLRQLAQALGYRPEAIYPHAKDRYQALRNSLKQQGFFERQLTVEDCLKLQQACRAGNIPCEKLNALLAYLPEQLAKKPMTLVKENPTEGRIETSAPLERMVTQALVHGVLSPVQFVALLASLDPTALDVTNAPFCSIKSGGLMLDFKMRQRAGNIRELSTAALANAIDPDSLRLNIPDSNVRYFGQQQNFSDLVAVGRGARRSGANFGEGQALLDRLLADKFRVSEHAPQQHLVAIHAAFCDLFGEAEGDALFFQQMKDFESRQERQFQSGDRVASTQTPADCPIAANHRNRLISRRNQGEVAVVEGTHQLRAADSATNLWVIGNDSDIVSAAQHEALLAAAGSGKKSGKKSVDPVVLGARCESPGVRLHPSVAAQHSRLVGEHAASDENIYSVPTRDWLQYLGRINNISAPVKGDGFAHKFAQQSDPFKARFGK